METVRGEKAARHPASPGRRAVLGAAVTLPALARPAAPQATPHGAPPTPGGITFLVPGPEDGPSPRWAARAADALARGNPRGPRPGLSVLGGPDGVTAANRFATLGDLDAVLLVVTGATAGARLAGGGRVRYEPSGWIPLLGSWGGAVLAGRGPLNGRDRSPVRVALSAPDAPEAAALAALDALGVPAQPVPGRPETAFAAGEADALLLVAPDPLAAATALGATPWHVFPPPSPEGEGAPLGGTTPMHRAARAAVAALQLRHLLVLPALCPADSVAAWRRAAGRWAEDGRADPADGRPLLGAEAVAALALAAPPPDAVLAYRSWLESRLGHRPG